MNALLRRSRKLCFLIVAMLLGATLTVFGPANSAQADPGCVTNGAYVLFVRGSGEDFNGTRALNFQHYVMRALANNGIPSSWGELGNIDGNLQVEFNEEYPATPVNEWWPPPPVYPWSVNVGVQELVTHLNDRYAGNGPTGGGACVNETLVLGGYSQGAHVIGEALPRLSQAARDHIGYVALYGDPKFDPGPLIDRINRANFQSSWWWVRGNGPGYRMIKNWPYQPYTVRNSGILGARKPYVSDEFKGRFGSWCADKDIFCAGHGNTDYHSNEYQWGWLSASADEIAYVAKIKRDRLAVGNTSSAGIGNVSTAPASAAVSTYDTDPTPNEPPPPTIRHVKRTKDASGTNQVYAATNSAVTEGWWKYGGDGVHTKEIIHISQDNITGFDKTNLPEGKQALFTAVPDGIWETHWDATHDPSSAKIISGLTGVRQVIADNRWEGPNKDQYTHRLYVLASDGPYEFWWRDGGDGIHKKRLDAIEGAVSMTASTGPSGEYQLYVATPTWAYELWWHPGNQVNHGPVINITQGDINSLSKITFAAGQQRLYTGTSTSVWQSVWHNSTPAHNAEVNGKNGIIDSEAMKPGSAFQIYICTPTGVQEYWWTTTNAGNSTITSRAAGDITAFTKSNDSTGSQVYTGTVYGEVWESYWGGGASPTTKKLMNVAR